MKFEKLLRAIILKNICERLLLSLYRKWHIQVKRNNYTIVNFSRHRDLTTLMFTELITVNI